MIEYIFLCLGAFFVGISKAAIDSTIVGVWSGSIFAKSKYREWLNNTQNKWKNGNRSEGEAFFLSATLLVWVTDLFHFANLISRLAFGIMCVSIAIISKGDLFQACLLYGGAWILNISVFHIFFHYIFNKSTFKFKWSF